MNERQPNLLGGKTGRPLPSDAHVLCVSCAAVIDLSAGGEVFCTAAGMWGGGGGVHEYLLTIFVF